jgi:hypothetical protein
VNITIQVERLFYAHLIHAMRPRPDAYEECVFCSGYLVINHAEKPTG